MKKKKIIVDKFWQKILVIKLEALMYTIRIIVSNDLKQSYWKNAKKEANPGACAFVDRGSSRYGSRIIYSCYKLFVDADAIAT